MGESPRNKSAQGREKDPRLRPSGCALRGALDDADTHAPIVIEGLWALDFGKGNVMTGDTDALYFTSGPNDEEDGLFGYLEPAGE